MSDSAVVSIPVANLQPDPNNVRREVGDVKELARSIGGVGVVEPLLVTPVDDQPSSYRIVAGHRRHAAAVEAGIPEVPCLVRALSEAEVIEIQLVENLQRCDISALEEAGAYLRLCGHGYSARRLAKAVGKPERHVRERLALLELPDSAQAAIDAGRVTLADAKVLLTVKDRPEVIEEVLAAGRGDVSWAVRNCVRQAADGEKRLALIEECKAAGLRVLRDDECPDGFTWLAETGMADKPHSEEPCHAVVVRTHYDGPHATPVCTDRKRHAQRGESGLKLPGRTTPDDGRRTQARSRQRVAAARRDFLAARLGTRLPRAVTIGFVVSSIIDASNAKQAEWAGRLLGLEPAKGTYGEDWLSPLRQLAAHREADGLRAAAAVAAGMSEASLSAHAYGGDHAVIYADFLAVLGYEADSFEVEQRDLARRRREAAATGEVGTDAA